MTDQTQQTSTPGSDENRGATPVRERVEQAIDTAREKTAAAYSTSRDKAADAVANARERASTAAQKTAENIDQYPVAALVGGLALGAIAAALLPTSRTERDLMAPLGSKFGETARSALTAAREAGQAQLGEFGLSSDKARDQVNKLFENALKVASEAGGAAVRSVRQGGSQA